MPLITMSLITIFSLLKGVNYFAWGLRYVFLPLHYALFSEAGICPPFFWPTLPTVFENSGLAVNEFTSGKYDEIPEGSDLTTGEELLIRFGFTLNGEPFTSEWRWYGIAFLAFMAAVSMLGSTILLRRVRFETGKSLVTDQGDNEVEEIEEADMVAIPFTKVDLTFKNIRYTVMSSISKEELTLLKGIDGYIKVRFSPWSDIKFQQFDLSTIQFTAREKSLMTAGLSTVILLRKSNCWKIELLKCYCGHPNSLCTGDNITHTFLLCGCDRLGS